MLGPTQTSILFIIDFIYQSLLLMEWNLPTRLHRIFLEVGGDEGCSLLSAGAENKMQSRKAPLLSHLSVFCTMRNPELSSSYRGGRKQPDGLEKD